MFGREWVTCWVCLVAAAALSGCGNSASTPSTNAPSATGGTGADGNPGSNASSGAGTATTNGLVVSHSDGGTNCTTFYGKDLAKTLIPAVAGPCPARTGVVCAKCENEYPNVLFAGDGIKSKDEVFSSASAATCADWADGSSRADVCEVEASGKFTALAPGVGGPSGLMRPETVPGTPTEGLGPYQFSVYDFRIVSGVVTLPSCSNYYGTGITDDMRWRGQTVPCPDDNRARTATRPYSLDGVAVENTTAESIFYNN
jgi:hypothetical protein